ncbi:TPA: hypothetical protein U2B17_001990 [Streptococcus suis]|nr:hypothetical protein [Streptococcus suis]HEM5936938.1 hypothetical protein [Streptococcus suis]HEM5941108.1 hypothetical protein [Streptococcus suis]HEM5947393.1 hypothetical protein [Streptococcus suis]HEM5951583.1 hypothetical protein [Streptococcus suis]
MSNMTKLAWLSGSVIKQGDVSSVFKLRLTTNDTAVLNGPATIQLIHKSKGMIEFPGNVVDNVISFQSDKALPIGSYIVEIEHAGYVFPSTNSVGLKVNENLGEFVSGEAIELYGLRKIVKEYVEQEQDVPDLLMFYNLGKV